MVGKSIPRRHKKKVRSRPISSSSTPSRIDSDSNMSPEDHVMKLKDGDRKTKDGPEQESSLKTNSTQVYLPGTALEQDEVLEYDASAYDMYHTLNVEWPCLSFGFLKDHLGTNRTQFPLTTYLVAGTQADRPKNNKLWTMKWSNLTRTKSSSDPDDSDSDSVDSEDMEENPSLSYKEIPLDAAVNRLKVMPSQDKHVVALWLDSGRVSIYDVSQMVKDVDLPQKSHHAQQELLYSFSGHASEGFSLDWSPLVMGRLATGDCKKDIYLWEPHESGIWTISSTPFRGHLNSVEDLQWSPTESDLLGSCSSDGTLKLWDVRNKDHAAASIIAHDSDVNVLSWNRNTSYLIVTGGDDGLFKIWDIRHLKDQTPAAQFKWHMSPITSLEWHPTDDSVLAVSGEDHQVSLWDLSLEKDSEIPSQEHEPDVPPQLLFIHQGQTDIKEVHWHPQIPGVLGTTALTGFNIFKTISV